MKTFLLIVALSAQALAQQQFTIPAPDGTTIKSTNNVWSCTVQSGLPPGMTFDSSTGTLTVAKLNLTGGETVPAGLYVFNVDASSNFTLTPYSPSTGSGLTISGQVVTVPSTAVAGFATIGIPLAVTAAPAPGTPSVVTLSSVTEMTKGGIFRYSYNVTKAGQVTLTVTSTVSSSQTYGPYTVNASVVQ